MTAEPVITKPLPGRIRALFYGAKVWASRRSDLAPDLYSWTCECGKQIRYWKGWRENVDDGQGSVVSVVRSEDVTETMRERLLKRAIETKVKAHVMGQKKRLALVDAALKDVTDWQEGHSPTRLVVLRDLDGKGRRHLTGGRRRIMDARLWDDLTPEQQDAAGLIVRGYELTTAGVGMKRRKYQPRELSVAEAMDARVRELSDGELSIMEWFWQWCDRVQARGLSLAAALDVIAHGKPRSAVERMNGKRHGWAKENLCDALNIYCRLRRWPQNMPLRRGQKASSVR